MPENEKVKADCTKGNKYTDHLQTCDEEHRSWAFENEFMWLVVWIRGEGRGKGTEFTETQVQVPSPLLTL